MMQKKNIFPLSDRLNRKKGQIVKALIQNAQDPSSKKPKLMDHQLAQHILDHKKDLTDTAKNVDHVLKQNMPKDSKLLSGTVISDHAKQLLEHAQKSLDHRNEPKKEHDGSSARNSRSPSHSTQRSSSHKSSREPSRSRSPSGSGNESGSKGKGTGKKQEKRKPNTRKQSKKPSKKH